MTVAGARSAPPTRIPGRARPRSRRGVPVARATVPAATQATSAARVSAPPVPRRRDLHVARRLRRRDALLGLGVLASALGATVAVLVVH